MLFRQAHGALKAGKREQLANVQLAVQMHKCVAATCAYDGLHEKQAWIVLHQTWCCLVPVLSPASYPVEPVVSKQQSMLELLVPPPHMTGKLHKNMCIEVDSPDADCALY